ncbi:MAG: acetylornithine deacetylase/succinyl-diaminopimelate desuccinylase-like protein [Myxococcota bacterium]|jgi:acetylornithine deacetylase/succinyl-diaminopimelate desuccinylase-like protein
MGSMAFEQTDDPALMTLVDQLCRIRSFWRPEEPGCDESAVAGFIAEHLRRFPWLTVRIEAVAPGRLNVVAFDGPEADTRLLIAGHIDTVLPVQNWTVPEHTVRDGRYHALGAADAKGAIAAALDAIGRVGPTQGVGYLLYCDEEYHFDGMKDFVARHPAVRPEHTLSLCGASAALMLGCRGLIELEFTLTGHPGHASRPYTGRSATHACTRVLAALSRWCRAHSTPNRTVINVAAIHAGSLAPEARIGTGGPPAVLATPNRIPDVAWVLIELRVGDPRVTAETLTAAIAAEIAAVNEGEEKHIKLADVQVHLDMPGYTSAEDLTEPLITPFAAVHCGRIAPVEETGYLDVALLCVRDRSAALCMGPDKGGAHGPDEWVDVESLIAYRDGLVSLIGQHST